MKAAPRPFGISSRFIRADGPRHPWTTGGVTIDLPVIVDWVNVDPATGAEWVRIEARVDLVGDKPEIVEMSFTARSGLDLAALQRDFQWASPLTAVTGILPRLIESGTNPFAIDLPIAGFPAVAIQPLRRRGVLSDEFLTTISREYLARGRGYAASLAEEYFVTPRTVVSWVEKARARGILSAPPSSGAAGGHLLAKAKGPAGAER
ncbi:MAG: hypothetical protein ACOYEV_14260 [Candidatus Nanopelagicales bacterium]